MPPRFIGVLYDHTLSTEAGLLAIVMARLCEAIVTINRVEQEQFAPCQVRRRRQAVRQTGSVAIGPRNERFNPLVFLVGVNRLCLS